MQVLGVCLKGQHSLQSSVALLWDGEKGLRSIMKWDGAVVQLNSRENVRVAARYLSLTP